MLIIWNYIFDTVNGNFNFRVEKLWIKYIEYNEIVLSFFPFFFSL